MAAHNSDPHRTALQHGFSNDNIAESTAVDWAIVEFVTKVGQNKSWNAFSFKREYMQLNALGYWSTGTPHFLVMAGLMILSLLKLVPNSLKYSK